MDSNKIMILRVIVLVPTYLYGLLLITGYISVIQPHSTFDEIVEIFGYVFLFSSIILILKGKKFMALICLVISYFYFDIAGILYFNVDFDFNITHIVRAIILIFVAMLFAINPIKQYFITITRFFFGKINK